MNGGAWVSAVIPVRDRAGIVGRAIDTALAQEGARIEVIVVDDGSADATPAVLSAYGERIIALRRGPTGRSAARNAGIERARGEFIAFLDSDDAWHADKIRRQLAFHAANPDVAMSAHGLEKIHPDGHREWSPPCSDSSALDESFLAIADHFAFVPSVVMVRAHVARAVGGFDTRFDGTEDLDFALKIAQRHRVAVFPDCLTRYYVHESQTGLRRLALGNARVLRHHLENSDVDDATRTRMRRRVARHMVSAAKRAISRDERRELLFEAAATDPRVRFRTSYLRQRWS